MVLTPEQAAEIDRLRAETHATLRPTVPALEELLYHPLPALDHGFVRVVDYMGDDGAIVQAARVSYGRGTKRVSEDRGLINYLIRHRHTTPFEMCEIKFHVKLPIFVARQWIRHRTANVNEYSARYSILDNEFYLPAPEHLAAQSDTNRQGRGQVLEGAEARRVLDLLREDATRNYDHYLEMLNEGAEGKPADPARPGLARELARMNLTLNLYTQWYWKIDLHNLMHFVSLRADAHAQYEIRAYAEVLLHVLDRWVPITAAACREHIVGGARISATGLKVVRRLLQGEKVAQADSGLQPREWRELAAMLGIDPGVTRPRLDPWSVLETREVFSAPPYLSVHSQRVGLPDGREVDGFYRVTLPDYALMFAETVDGRVLVLRQYKHGVGAVSLTFPAGTFNAGEEALACAKRELMEETGHEAAAWRPLGRYVSHANAYGNAANLFHATGCRKIAEPNSGDLEEMELLLMTRAELFAAARRGEFKLTSQIGILALVTHPMLGEASSSTA